MHETLINSARSKFEESLATRHIFWRDCGASSLLPEFGGGVDVAAEPASVPEPSLSDGDSLCFTDVRPRLNAMRPRPI